MTYVLILSAENIADTLIKLLVKELLKLIRGKITSTLAD
jgi:hypothetical protein